MLLCASVSTSSSAFGPSTNLLHPKERTIEKELITDFVVIL